MFTIENTKFLFLQEPCFGFSENLFKEICRQCCGTSKIYAIDSSTLKLTEEGPKCINQGIKTLAKNEIKVLHTVYFLRSRACRVLNVHARKGSCLPRLKVS